MENNKNAQEKNCTVYEYQIKTLIENDATYMTRKLPEMLNILNLIIDEQFVKLGYINHFDVWVFLN